MRCSERRRATVHVPAMGPGCSSHLFGVIQVYDKSPVAWRVVHVVRDDKIVRRLSLKQVSRLPVDDEWIARELAVNRRQVINFRKCARERLARRMRKHEEKDRRPVVARPSFVTPGKQGRPPSTERTP